MIPLSFRGTFLRALRLAGYPLVADFEINPAGLGIVKMSRLQNVDFAVLPKSHFSGRL
jgi:hypothetical protein